MSESWKSLKTIISFSESGILWNHNFRDSGVEFYEIHDFRDSGMTYLNVNDFHDSGIEF